MIDCEWLVLIRCFADHERVEIEFPEPLLSSSSHMLHLSYQTGFGLQHRHHKHISLLDCCWANSECSKTLLRVPELRAGPNGEKVNC